MHTLSGQNFFSTTGPSTKKTITNLHHCFSRLEFPVTIVSDNGTCFTNSEFKEFLNMNGIRHVTSAVYKPSSNGLAERMVQTFKRALSTSNEHVSVLLDKLRFNYRITPHSSTEVSPAELMFKRRLRCRLDLLYPCYMVGNKVVNSKKKRKRYYSNNPRHVISTYLQRHLS